ncbi:MAG: hypothetical protein IT537_22295 [Hyphomicrobiales bacterium]|nr:hypothetical protein [Hyphomicrobiales bacterium]
MISAYLRAVVVASALLPAIAAPAAAASFDGPWSVVISTRSGACDQSYRFGVMIRGGQITYQGSGAVSASGRVSKSGSVVVHVSSGSQTASGSGRLGNGRGGGTWRGRGNQGACSGTWSASQG